MSITANRTVTVTLSGDTEGSFPFTAASSTTSPGVIGQLYTLSPGANAITIPVSGYTTKAATIIPPAGNTNLITLKGTTADTGIAIHRTDPTSLGLDTTQTTITLTVSTTVTGVKIAWN